MIGYCSVQSLHGSKSDLIYDFLIMLSKRLTEIDVSIILAVLQCCGMKIRADDPAAMKNFILSVQNTTNELKASSGDNHEKKSCKRMEFVLEANVTSRTTREGRKKPLHITLGLKFGYRRKPTVTKVYHRKRRSECRGSKPHESC